MLHRIVLRDPEISQWLTFTDPVDVLLAQRPADVLPVLRAAERRVRNEGLYAAGFLTYEAAAGFDDALRTHAAAQLPLVCLGLFSEGDISDRLPDHELSGVAPVDWRISESGAAYAEKIDRIKRRIESGDTYQINYTVRKSAEGIDNSSRRGRLRALK